MTDERPHIERAGDKGFWCVVARRFSDVWDFLENRNIFEHVLTIWTVYMVERVTVWAMHFADYHPEMDDTKLGLTIAAVGTTLALFATPVAKFWFERK